MQTGLISNIQKYSVDDGPGIRTTVFLKGCPLHCAWCHNPENISPEPQLIVFQERCIHCGDCRRVCPVWRADTGARPSNSGNGSEHRPGRGTNHKVCLVCGACAQVCPTSARVKVGRWMTVDELMVQLLADRLFYDDSRGGVTFSGGEPLAQWQFVKAALQRCRELGVHTALDTCGFAPRERLLALAPLVDLFLYDLKLMNERRHVEFCGVSNRLILENLRALVGRGCRVWVRVPLIPGVNDSSDELEAMVSLVKDLTGVDQVSLLPYHRTGIHKFGRLGQSYRFPELQAPSAEVLDSAVARFASAGVRVKVGGA